MLCMCGCVCVCVRGYAPVVSVIGLGSSPPDVGVVHLQLSAVCFLLGFAGAAHKLDATETVDATWQQHAVVMEIHGAVPAGLATERGRETDRERK